MTYKIRVWSWPRVALFLGTGITILQFLITNRRIRVSRLQGKFATNGKSRVSDYELKTLRSIGIKSRSI
jgi:hypothetical protein